MFAVNVLLSGRLLLDGYGRHFPREGDGTFKLTMKSERTVAQLIRSLRIPLRKVAMVMVNGRKVHPSAAVKADDRVILIPVDVALLWGFIGKQNLGMASVLDF